MLSNEQVLGLRQALYANEVVMVEFTKSNGDLREIVCSKNPEVVGVEWEYKGGTSPADNDTDNDLQVVFDVDAKGFRSFKYSAVNKWAISH